MHKGNKKRIKTSHTKKSTEKKKDGGNEGTKDYWTYRKQQKCRSLSLLVITLNINRLNSSHNS